MYKEEREKDRRKEGRKDEEGRRRKRGAKLAAFQYASEMECKNRNCKMCNCKLGWTNAGIASDVSRRLFHNPPLSFLRGFLPTLRNGLRDQFPSLFYSPPSRATRTILSMIAEEDFTSISPRNLQLRTQMIRLRRDAIIEMSFPAENKCPLPSSDFLLPESVS